MRLTIRKGECIVTVPKYIPNFIVLPQVEKFIKSKSEWIKKHIEQSEKKKISEVEDKQKYLYIKDELLTLIKQRLEYFNHFYGYTYKAVKVKKVSSRWGSCSKKGNLNFNYKLAFLTEEERDYVIVHELCHLGEFNHGINFWNLVSRAVPNHIKIRKGMKGRVI
jgi:predicted metal-dependent hydrolase